MLCLRPGRTRLQVAPEVNNSQSRRWVETAMLQASGARLSPLAAALDLPNSHQLLTKNCLNAARQSEPRYAAEPPHTCVECHLPFFQVLA